MFEAAWTYVVTKWNSLSHDRRVAFGIGAAVGVVVKSMFFC